MDTNPRPSRKSKVLSIGKPGPAIALYNNSPIKEVLDQLLALGKNSKKAKDPSRKLFQAIRGGDDYQQCEECFNFVKIKDFKLKHDTTRCMAYP